MLAPMDDIVEEETATYMLALALQRAHDKRPGLLPDILRCAVTNWAHLVIVELRTRRVHLVLPGKITEFPAGRRWKPPAYMTDVAAPKQHVSTPDLRLHAFAAYAAAMAHEGPEKAFEAAVWETLRRARDWDLRAAGEHTRRFIVPAWERAFPPRRRQ